MRALIVRSAAWVLLLLVWGLLVPVEQPLHAQATSADGYIRSPRLGFTFVSTGNPPNAAERYRNALLLGAGWTRYPFYWNSLETAPGQWNWAAYDPQVIADVRSGLRINAILMGIPPFQADGGAIRSLSAPVFADGTDTPGAGKPINPANPYAVYVAQTVNRYKPGGTLAVQQGWGAGVGVSIWEAWNEPDLGMFWTGGVEAYARVLKVTYLAVRAADPSARVMFAGLAFNNPDTDNWLDRTLAVLARDPAAAANNWYFDIAAVHAYSSARRSGVMVRRIRETLNRYGIARPIWLNESGIPVWDDYPGPTWTRSTPADRLYRGTMIQQAAYVIQSTALAWANGADVVFFHQLYDDCGNQPAGTDFAPNTRSAGDAFGIFRNVRGMSCFSQHPQPGTPRPAAAAFRLMAQVFGQGTFVNPQVINLGGRATLISFDRQSPFDPANFDQRVYVVWNRTGEWLNLLIPASGGTTMLYTMDNQDFAVNATAGEYTIGLQPAAPPGYPTLNGNDLAEIGAPPYVMVETLFPGTVLADPNQAHFEGEPPPGQATDPAESGQPALGTLPPPPPDSAPVPTSVPPPPPTLDPAFDTAAPRPFVGALPPVSGTPFGVLWGAGDESGIAGYVVWVRVDGGAWAVWLETTDTQALYDGEPGRTYEFALWAVDLAGNWSDNIDLTPMAVTRVE
ncbi:MAG: hypothetical protein SF162_09180 [bacterium]|nr:hypothetical protein [bacterium]